ncbi:[acyl-carrier-protein] S-malonyltransferase [candidate division KSB1 bacterium RBG_16_48_16]|nr:MAG: [acyl-carrier-protein] S-malonyltransferase [candidate division KSB1 bacterium RBG_16_48_16]
MGNDLYDKFQHAKEMYRHAERILHFDIADISFNGPEEKLRETQFTQPALFVHSAVLTRMLLSKGARPACVAGHSLGEYSALLAAEALSFEEGVKLVRSRAELMQNAGKDNKGTMAAIIGLAVAEVEEACRQASVKGVVRIANLNSPVQTVISGSVEGVQQAMKLAQEAGAKRVIRLNVSGAFHSELMQPAVPVFEKSIESAGIMNPAVPVYANVTAKATTDREEIRQLLAKQLVNPVRWTETINNMISDGVDRFVEVGSGTVLSGLVKRISTDVRVENISSVEELENFDHRGN